MAKHRDLFEDDASGIDPLGDDTADVGFTDDTDSSDAVDQDIYMIGVVGDMTNDFDADEARAFLEQTFDTIEQANTDVDGFAVVSKLIDTGIPGLAYQIADERGYETWGIAPTEAKQADWYSVDYHVISGDNWGDESQEFVDDIDVFVRVGGDAQAHDEEASADAEGLTVYEYDFDGSATSSTDDTNDDFSLDDLDFGDDSSSS